MPSDREMLFQIMTKLMEQNNIAIPKPEQLLPELRFEFTNDRVYILRTNLRQEHQINEDDNFILEINLNQSTNRNANLGDPTCLHSANSPYLRCAINPCGPCYNCLDYQPGVGGPGGAL